MTLSSESLSLKTLAPHRHGRICLALPPSAASPSALLASPHPRPLPSLRWILAQRHDRPKGRPDFTDLVTQASPA